jgi:CHAD domain-containing protein
VAKARRIHGLSADGSYAAAAAKVVAVRAQELVDHSAGVLDTGDIERVHDMRVATRRLRAALEVFEPCFPGKRLAEDLGEVKALADALGERRDRDVAIAALGELAAKMAAPDRPGIDSLIDRLRAEQRGANENLARHVSSDRIEALHERLADLVAEAWGEAPEDTPPGETARSNGSGA